MTEFADNNALSSTTGLTPFFANKGFHPRMSFDFDSTFYASTRERLQAAKAEDITETMKNILEYVTGKSKIAKEAMIEQANKHRKDVSYQVGDKMFLSSKNIKTARFSSKLEDKMLSPFETKKIVETSYQLDLPTTMRTHDVFHPSLLRKDPGNPLPGQVQKPPGPVTVEDEPEWEVDDILDSRHYGRNKRLQYRVK